MEVLALLLAVTIGIFIIGAMAVYRDRLRSPRRQYSLEPSSLRERLLLWSLVPCAAIAFFFLSLGEIDRLAPIWLASLLDKLCPNPIPNFWCMMPRPIPWLVAVHAVVYCAFVLVSLYLVFAVASGKIPKPLRYVEGSLPIYTQLFLLSFWLFLVAGGQFMVGRLSHISPTAAFFVSLMYLSFGLCAARNLAISIKYHRPPSP